jgi:hypothetical protein
MAIPTIAPFPRESAAAVEFSAVIVSFGPSVISVISDRLVVISKAVLEVNIEVIAIVVVVGAGLSGNLLCANEKATKKILMFIYSARQDEKN